MSRKKKTGNSINVERLMVLKNPYTKTLKSLLSINRNPVFQLTNTKPNSYIQTKTYVNVYMKRKKDAHFDSIEHINKSKELKSIISLKNIIAQNPNGCISISDVSKRGHEFDVKIRVARFLRQYPSIFEEFTGPKYNLPWFRLTQEAIEIGREEGRVFEECKEELRDRLKRFVLMSREKMVPLKIIQGMLWYLGLPEDFLKNPEPNFDDSFEFVELEDGFRGLRVDCDKKVLSFLQKNAMKRNSMGVIEFPLFPSKGLRLKRKIIDWLQEFQKLSYVSPYDGCSSLDPNSDTAEKRLVGFLHELLCLFVDHSAERRKLLCLKKYFRLPQKMHKAFERHPHMFYLSMKSKTCTVILKEAYRDEFAIEKHPLFGVRKKYVDLMMESKVILKKRRSNHGSSANVSSPEFDVHSDFVHQENMSNVSAE